MWLCRWDFFHDHVQFGGHRHGGSGYIMVLVCHVILQDLMTKVSFAFKGWEPLMGHPANFGVNRHLGSGDRHFSLSPDRARLRHESVMRFYGWKLLILSHYPARFGGYYQWGRGDIMVLVYHLIQQVHLI